MISRPVGTKQALICVLLVAGLAVLAYRSAISSDFTGGDTVSLIEVSRIRSLNDFGTMLTQPMLPIITKFYRPTANFSYAIDSWIWGLDARGFHITDVAIHSMVSVLIACLVLRCAGNPLGALLAGATFALHPSLMETVPSSARRHDMIAGMFMLLSLLSLPDAGANRPRARRWILPLCFCALALGAKEASIVFPAVVFAWAFLVRSENLERRAAWKEALRTCAPFFAVGLFFVGLRTWVLGGAGGNVQSWNWTLASIPGMGVRAADFLGDLVYPLRVVFHPYLSTTDRAIAGAAAVGFCALIPAIGRWWNAPTNGASARGSSRAILYLFLGVCICVLLFPALSWWLRGGIEQAYRKEGWSMLASRIDPSRKQPVEFYLWRAFDLARMAASAALVISGALLAIARWRARTSEPVARARESWASVLAIWMTLHLALFLAVQRYHSWYAYVPAIPFCCWLGMAISNRDGVLRTRAALTAGLMLWLAAYSPLVRGLDSWQANGEFNTQLMSEIARVAAGAPEGSTLDFIDLPNQNLSWQERGPRPLSTFTINRASTISWVKLAQPDKRLRVEVRSQKSVPERVAAVHLDCEQVEDQRILVRARITPAH